MKILTACVLAAIGLSAVSWAQAANSDKAIVWREWIDTVTPAHELACEAAQESFVQRLREPREVQFSCRHALNRQRVPLFVRRGPVTWAELDAVEIKIAGTAEDDVMAATWRTVP